MAYQAGRNGPGNIWWPEPGFLLRGTEADVASNPLINNIQAKALLGNGKASLVGSVITPVEVAVTTQVRHRALSSGTRREPRPAYGPIGQTETK